MLKRNDSDSTDDYYPLRWKFADTVEDLFALHRGPFIAILGLIVIGLLLLGFLALSQGQNTVESTSITVDNGDATASGDDGSTDTTTPTSVAPSDDDLQTTVPTTLVPSLRAVESDAELDETTPGALFEVTPTSVRLLGGLQTDAMADDAVERAEKYFPNLSIDDQQRVDPSFPPLGQVTMRFSGPNLFNSSAINETYLELIDELAAGITTESIDVIGYTDDSGPAAGNLRLSEGRAQTAANRLIAGGVPAAQVASAGLGEASPVTTNATEEGRLMNRRVEFVVSG